MRTDTEPAATRSPAPLLTGRLVTLTPYHEPTDARPLFDLTPPGTLQYFPSNPIPWTPDTLRDWLHRAQTEPRRTVLTVRSAATGDILGCSSFMDADPTHRSVEIGATWYAPHAQGTSANPECKLLMLGFAFDGGLARHLAWPSPAPCERVQIKCDARNLRSQRAIEKLGATREGVLRRQRICTDGYIRDTVVYSILAAEWPGVRARLLPRVQEPVPHPNADRGP